MSKRKPFARLPLPKVIDPPGVRCFKVNVPNDRLHIAAFLGTLWGLASAYAWENDDAHTAVLVAERWKRVYLELRECLGDQLNTSGGADGGDENMIRQNPDNPCELQTSIDGTHWCTFADLSLCLPAPSQPGDGTTQPASNGGQACYHAEMVASNRYLVPTIVSAGDTVDLTNANGAGNDGTVSPWQCPDGSTFFAGACIGGTGASSGSDPLPSVDHMRLVFNIDGTFYDAMGGPVTVPGGVTNAQVYVQVNDSDIADNAGSYRFDVCVTNNAAATWAHVFDFALTNGAFTTPTPPFGGDFGTWTPGLGWVADHVEHPSGFWYNQLVLNRTIPSRTITRVVVTFNVHGISTNQSTANARFDVVLDSTQIDQKLFSDTTEGDGLVSDHSMSQSGVTNLEVDIASSFYNSATFTGSAVITSIRLEGLGTDPF